MTTEDTAEVLFDPARLAALVGHRLRADRLRHKVGHSTVAVLTGPEGPAGWIRVVQPELTVKLDNIVRRAGERGRTVLTRDVPGTRLRLAAGGLATDPRLSRALDELAHSPEQLSERLGTAPARRDELFAPASNALRYNPLRRLVLRDDTGDRRQVLRLSAEENPAYLTEVLRLRALGAPVAAPTRVGRRLTRWPWLGTTDLAALIQAGSPGWQTAVAEAGRTLAQVHEAGRDSAPGATAETTQLAGLRKDLTALDAALGERFGRLADAARDRTAPQVHGLIHGDCSADQVAVDAGTLTTTWLDLERARPGDVREDLATFAAVELLRAPATATAAVTAFLTGYATDWCPEDLRPWTAAALLKRVLEPFRAADPDWRAGVAARLDQVEELL